MDTNLKRFLFESLIQACDLFSTLKWHFLVKYGLDCVSVSQPIILSAPLCLMENLLAVTAIDPRHFVAPFSSYLSPGLMHQPAHTQTECMTEEAYNEHARGSNTTSCFPSYSPWGNYFQAISSRRRIHNGNFALQFSMSTKSITIVNGRVGCNIS